MLEAVTRFDAPSVERHRDEIATDTEFQRLGQLVKADMKMSVRKLAVSTRGTYKFANTKTKNDAFKAWGAVQKEEWECRVQPTIAFDGS